MLAAKVDTVGVEIEDEFDGENSFKENALLFMTFDDVKEKQMELDLAEKKLIAAEIKLNDTNITIEDKIAVEQAITSYSDTVVDYVNFVEDVRITDYEYAEELEQYVEDMILVQKKNLSFVLPDSPSYYIKETVDELEILMADDLDAEIILMSEHGLEKLAEVEDAIEKGDAELAVQIADEYMEEVDNVIKVIGSIDEDEELKAELIDDVKAGITLLDKIEEVDTGVKMVTDYEIVEIVIGFDDTSIEREVMEAVKEDEVIIFVPIIKEEPIIEAEYGVIIEGDKPLSPLLF